MWLINFKERGERFFGCVRVVMGFQDIHMVSLKNIGILRGVALYEYCFIGGTCKSN